MRIRLGPCICLIGTALAALLCAATGRTQSQLSGPSVAQGSSCSLPGLAAGSAKRATVEDFLAAYNAQAAMLHSLRGSLILRVQGEAQLNATMNQSRPFPAMLTFRSPASVRLTGVIPYSARRSFDLASDGREFRLLVPDGNTMHFFVGPADAPETSANPKENIRPQMILEAVRWLPAKLENSSVHPPMTKDGNESIDVELTTSTGRMAAAQLEFDLRNATLARLALLDSLGRAASEVDYSDWQTVPAAGDEKGPACFPRRIYVSQPQQNRRFEIKFLSVQLNVAILPAQFQLIPPPGVTVTRVGAAASRSDGGTKP
jgi:hypothetical protein